MSLERPSAESPICLEFPRIIPIRPNRYRPARPVDGSYPRNVLSATHSPARPSALQLTSDERDPQHPIAVRMPVGIALTEHTVRSANNGCLNGTDRKSTRLNSSHLGISY